MADFDLDPKLVLALRAVLGGGVDRATLDAAATFLAERFDSGPELSQSLWGNGIQQRENIISYLRDEYAAGRGAGDRRTLQQLRRWYLSGPSEGQRGNPTYVARRLANTEAAFFFQALDNAFDAEAEAEGLIDGYQILLSPDHPEPDECDFHAENGPYATMEEAPEPPFHPLCQCRRAPIIIPIEEQRDREGRRERVAQRRQARARVPAVQAERAARISTLHLPADMDWESIQAGAMRAAKLMQLAYRVSRHPTVQAGFRVLLQRATGYARFGEFFSDWLIGQFVIPDAQGAAQWQIMGRFFQNAGQYYKTQGGLWVRDLLRRPQPVPLVAGVWDEGAAAAAGRTGSRRAAEAESRRRAAAAGRRGATERGFTEAGFAERPRAPGGVAGLLEGPTAPGRPRTGPATKPQPPGGAPATIRGSLPGPGGTSGLDFPTLPTAPMPAQQIVHLNAMDDLVFQLVRRMPEPEQVALRALARQPTPADLNPAALFKIIDDLVAPKEPQQWQIELVKQYTVPEVVALAVEVEQLLAPGALQGGLVWSELKEELALLDGLTGGAKPAKIVLVDGAGAELSFATGGPPELLTAPGSVFVVEGVGETASHYVVTVRVLPRLNATGQIDLGPITVNPALPPRGPQFPAAMNARRDALDATAIDLYERIIGLDGDDLASVLMYKLDDVELRHLSIEVPTSTSKILTIRIDTDRFVASRSFDLNGVVTHDNFKVDRAYRGQGIGARFIENSLTLYRITNQDVVRTLASTMPGEANGAYTWARLGFVPESNLQMRAIYSNIGNIIADNEAALVAQFGAEKVAHARHVALSNEAATALGGADPYALWEIADIPGLGRHLLADSSGLGYVGRFALDDPAAAGRLRQSLGRMPVPIVDEMVRVQRLVLSMFPSRGGRPLPRLSAPLTSGELRDQFGFDERGVPVDTREAVRREVMRVAYGDWLIDGEQELGDVWDRVFPARRSMRRRGDTGLLPQDLLRSLERILPARIADQGSITLIGDVGASWQGNESLSYIFRWPGFEGQVKFHPVPSAYAGLPEYVFTAEVISASGGYEDLRRLVMTLATAMEDFSYNSLARIDVPSRLTNMYDAVSLGMFPVDTALAADAALPAVAAARIEVEVQRVLAATNTTPTRRALINRLFREGWLSGSTTFAERLAPTYLPEGAILRQVNPPDIMYSVTFQGADRLGNKPISYLQLLVGAPEVTEPASLIADRFRLEQAPFSRIVPSDPDLKLKLATVSTSPTVIDAEKHMLATMFRETTLDELNAFYPGADEESLEIWNAVIKIPPELLQEYLNLGTPDSDTVELTIRTLDPSHIHLSASSDAIQKYERSLSFSLDGLGDPDEGTYVDFLQVGHSHFRVRDSYQKQGISVRVNRMMMEVYERWGVEEIEITASLSTGGYTWARFGFYPEDPEGAVDMAIRRIENRIVSREDLALAQLQGNQFRLQIAYDNAKETVELSTEGVELLERIEEYRGEVGSIMLDADVQPSLFPEKKQQQIAYLERQIQQAEEDLEALIIAQRDDLIELEADALANSFSEEDLVAHVLGVDRDDIDLGTGDPYEARELFWRLADSPDGWEIMGGTTWSGRLELGDGDAMERFDGYTMRGIPWPIIEDQIAVTGSLKSARAAISNMQREIRKHLQEAQELGGLGMRDEAISRFLSQEYTQRAQVSMPVEMLEAAMSPNLQGRTGARIFEQYRGLVGDPAPLDLLYAFRTIRGVTAEDALGSRLDIQNGRLVLDFPGIRFSITGPQPQPGAPLTNRMELTLTDARRRTFSARQRLELYADAAQLGVAIRRPLTVLGPIEGGAAELVPLLLASAEVELVTGAWEAVIADIASFGFNEPTQRAALNILTARSARDAAGRAEALRYLANVDDYKPILERLAYRVREVTFPFAVEDRTRAVLGGRTYSLRAIGDVNASGQVEPPPFGPGPSPVGDTLDPTLTARAAALANIRGTRRTPEEVIRAFWSDAPMPAWNVEPEHDLQLMEEIAGHTSRDGLAGVLRLLHAINLPSGVRFGPTTGLTRLELNRGGYALDLDFRYPGVPVPTPRLLEGIDSPSFDLEISIRLNQPGTNSPNRVAVRSYLERSRPDDIPQIGRPPAQRAAMWQSIIQLAAAVNAPRVSIPLSNLDSTHLQELWGLGAVAGRSVREVEESATALISRLQHTIDAGQRAGEHEFLEKLLERLRYDYAAQVTYRHPPYVSEADRVRGVADRFSRIYLAYADQPAFGSGLGYDWMLDLGQRFLDPELQIHLPHRLAREHRAARVQGQRPTMIPFMTSAEVAQLERGELTFDPYNEKTRNAKAVMTGELERIEEIKVENTDVAIDIIDKGE